MDLIRFQMLSWLLNSLALWPSVVLHIRSKVSSSSFWKEFLVVGSGLFCNMKNNFLKPVTMLYIIWVSGYSLLWHFVITWMGLRIISYHHYCVDKRVKEKKLGVWEAFWLLCKFLRVERPIECTGLRTWIGQLLTSEEIWSIKQGVSGRVPGSFMIFVGQGNCLCVLPGHCSVQSRKASLTGEQSIGFSSLKKRSQVWVQCQCPPT